MSTDYRVPSFLGFLPAGFRSGQKYILPLADLFLPQTGRSQIKLAGLVLNIDSSFPNERLISFCGNNILRKYARSPLGCLIANLSNNGNGGFVDIGSHMGIYSLWANQCGFKCTMIEPETDAFAFIERNPSIGKVFPVALADSDGVTRFFSSETGATSSLIGNSDPSEQGSLVTVRQSGSFLISNLPDPSNVELVKIDVEGVECRVLSGLTDFLEVSKPLIWCEVRGGMSPRAPNTCVEAVKIMEKFGYDALLPRNGDCFEQFSISDANDRGVFDLLFVPKNDVRIEQNGTVYRAVA